MRRILRSGIQGIGLLTLLSIIAGIGYLWHADGWALTPERAAKRNGYCQNAPVVKVQQQSPTIALAVCQGMPKPLDGGHVLVSRLPWGLWWASPSGGNFSYQSPEVVSTPLVDYIHSGPTQSVYTSLIMLGRSRSADVTRVEARLSDGRTLSNEVTHGLFVFDAPIQAIGVKVTELKVIGQNNQILQHIEVKSGY